MFHIALYEASQNEFLIEQVREMQRRVRPYRRMQLRARARIIDSFQEHEGIVEAILAGDGELVAERLRAHVMVQGKRFADLVESLEKLTTSKARLSA